MSRDFSNAICRALQRECKYDFLKDRAASGSRRTWGRLANLVAILRSGEQFNCAKLARAARCSTKTIHRDVEFLRAQGVRINFDFSAGTYALEDFQSVPWRDQLLEEGK